MPSSETTKLYDGNVGLYLTLDKRRQRPFLRRNITLALEQHRQALCVSQSGANEGMCEDASRNAWDLPDQATMAALSANNKPTLKIEVKYLTSVNCSDPSGGLGTSKRKTKLFAATCRLDFIFHEASDRTPTETKYKGIYNPACPATIQAWRNERGENLFSVHMDKPLLVTADDLKIQVPVGQKEKAYMISMSRSYLLAVNMLFDDHEYMDMILPILNSEGNALSGSKTGKLHANLIGLPLCPSAGHRAPMRYTVGGQTHSLGYEMAMDAGWEVHKEMPLQVYNRALACVRGKQLLSPISDPGKMACLAYWFKDQVRPRAVSVEGFLCLFCNLRDYNSLERLHHHFKADHDMFTFKVGKLGDHAPACLQNEIKIEVDISNKYSDPRASNNVADPREIRWIAPLDPFDLAAYLKDDESWIARGLRLKKKAQLAPAIAPLRRGSIELKEAVEVQDMPRVQKRKHRVPKAPNGLRFYRTDSKRPLEEGEYLSESDDEISEDWLKLRRNQATKDAGMSVSAKVFMMKWDDYMQDEQLSGDRHVGDAVVRFARKYRSWLRRRDMGNEFLRKTSELHSDSIICGEVLDACIDLIEGEGSMMDAVTVSAQAGGHRQTSSASGPNGSLPQPNDYRSKQRYVPGRPGGRERRFDVVEDGQRRSKKAKTTASSDNSMASRQESAGTLPTIQYADANTMMAEEVDQRSSTKSSFWEGPPEQPTMAVQRGCICGKVVDDDVAAISCANLDCQQREFHLQCVGLARRTQNWLCKDCTS